MAEDAPIIPLSLSSAAPTVSEAKSSDGVSHDVFNEGIILIFMMLMIFMLFESYRHKNHLKFGHEASLVCVIGIIISACYYCWGSEEFNDIMEFSDDMFFYFLLPPILFASGFNMYRKKFFANLGNIILFGVIGTFITFAVFSGLTVLFLNNFEFSQSTINPVTGEWQSSTVSLSTIEILLMCSLLCSTDVVAAVTLIQPKKQPKLFSIVFGEGITNDAISIILFNTVNNFAMSGDTTFSGKTLGTVSLGFILLGIVSILIGLAFGLLQSYMMKKCRSLTRDPVAECAIIFALAYISYIVAELAHQSGIIALMTCGITMAHYGWYNLSPQGQSSSNVVFSFLGFLAEGFVFSYIGLTFFSYRTMPFSVSLISLLFFVIIVGRGIATMGLVSLLKLCNYEKGSPNPLTYKELGFIWYAGLIRGAIAFGLVLRIDESFAGRDLIVTTCLTLVVLTTVLFGSTVGLLGSCLFDKSKEPKKQEGEIEEEVKEPLQEVASPDNESDDSSDASSDRSEMQHPNQKPLVVSEQASSQVTNPVELGGLQRRLTEKEKKERRRERKTCKGYLMRFDEVIMKPLFIRKYTPESERLADEFIENYIENGLRAEHDFAASGGGSLKVQKTFIQHGREIPVSNSINN